MSPEVRNNRWQVRAEQFAVRMTVSDLKGLLSRTLVIEPGTRAVIVEDGNLAGETGPGEYTLESAEQKLAFWKAKQSTVVLARMEDVPFQFTLRQLPTAENLLVDVNLNLTVQLANTINFLHNLMGPREAVTRVELQKMLSPLIHRAMWDAIGSSSIEELSTPGIAERLAQAADSSLQVSCERYGLNFVDIQTVSIRHEKFDKLQKKSGALELVRMGIAQKAKLDELYDENELRKIKHKERLNGLRVLAAQVETDGMESRLAARIERIEVEDRIRETLNDEHFDKLNSKEELRDRIVEIDSRRVMRREQIDDLIEGFNSRKADRKGARKHFVETLELQRRQELIELRQDINHATQLRTIDHEMEIASRLATKDSAAWRQKLEQRKAEAAWQDQRTGERSDKQLDRLAKIQSLNTESREHRKRLDSELAGTDHDRNLERMKVMGDLSSDALIASANVDNAALLADVKKQEATGLSEAERRELYDRLSAAERAKADAIAEAYRQTTQILQNNSQDMLQAVTQMNSPAPAAPSPPPTVTQWFVAVNGQQTGPFSDQQLRDQIQSGIVRSQTLLWRNGHEWMAASQIPELANTFAACPPPPPPPESV